MTRADGRRRAMAENKDVEFYSVFDGTKGRPESTYLDMQEREQAEKSRAIAEGREPETDLGKLPAAVGTMLVTEGLRVDNSYYSNPPMALEVVENKDVGALATLPVSYGTDDDGDDNDDNDDDGSENVNVNNNDDDDDSVVVATFLN